MSNYDPIALYWCYYTVNVGRTIPEIYGIFHMIY